MEPAQVKVVYTTTFVAENVSQDKHGIWGLIGLGNCFWLGTDKPDISTGDRVRITITKEPDDAITR